MYTTKIARIKVIKYKSSIESYISHGVVKYFSYEPKAYFKNTIENSLKLRQHELNGIDIISLF